MTSWESRDSLGRRGHKIHRAEGESEGRACEDPHTQVLNPQRLGLGGHGALNSLMQQGGTRGMGPWEAQRARGHGVMGSWGERGNEGHGELTDR